MPTKGLSFSKSVVSLVVIFLWIAGFLLALSLNPPMDGVYPAVWIFVSSILLLFCLLIRFKVQLTVTLFLKRPTVYWLLFSTLLAFIFWLIEHYLSNLLSPSRMVDNINRWRHDVSNYNLLSVCLSSVLLAPVFEELYFRGLLLNTLLKKMSFRLSVLLSALLFALIHWSWPDFISLFLIGLIYGWMTIKSNSLYPALLAHIIHNALTFWLYASF